MPLLEQETRLRFCVKSIHKGSLIRAQYHTWPAPQNGIVAAVGPEKLLVLYLPGCNNVSNYFPILVSEVLEGAWKIGWSDDLQAISWEPPLEQEGDL